MLEGTAGPTEESLLAELAELSTGHAPRRFALCMVDVERDDGAVLGWGLALPDEAVACMYGATVSSMNIMRAGDASHFPQMLRRADDVRLLWLDALEPEP